MEENNTRHPMEDQAAVQVLQNILKEEKLEHAGPEELLAWYQEKSENAQRENARRKKQRLLRNILLAAVAVLLIALVVVVTVGLPKSVKDENSPQVADMEAIAEGILLTLYDAESGIAYREIIIEQDGKRVEPLMLDEEHDLLLVPALPGNAEEMRITVPDKAHNQMVILIQNVTE